MSRSTKVSKSLFLWGWHKRTDLRGATYYVHMVTRKRCTLEEAREFIAEWTAEGIRPTDSDPYPVDLQTYRNFARNGP